MAHIVSSKGEALSWEEFPAPTSPNETILEKQYSEMLHEFPSSSPQDFMENLTIYEVIEQSDQMTELLKCFKQHLELVAALSDTASEYTVWASTNEALSVLLGTDVENAFGNTWGAVLRHHVSPHLLPIRRLLDMSCIPTLLEPSTLNGEQRLRLRPTPAGMTVNFNTHIIKGDIIASNGVIHLIDSVIFPPPSIMEVISNLPDHNFSIAREALRRTGLALEINTTVGGTLFVPSNAAFKKLGTKANVFLLENEDGEKLLQALLKFHFAPAQTLYSNAFYKPSCEGPPKPSFNIASQNKPQHRLIKGTRTFGLETALPGNSLQVGVSRYAGMIAMIIDQVTPVTTQDLVASNGVVHLLSSVLLPAGEILLDDDGSVGVTALKSRFNLL